MTKTNSFRITDKLPVWLAVPAVLIIAGLVIFFLLGFQPSATIAGTGVLKAEIAIRSIGQLRIKAVTF